MRIAWLTPYSARSAIGEFSLRVTAALAERADVELYTADAEPLHPAWLPLVRFRRAEELRGAFAGHDAVVYNLGNHLARHGEILDASRAHPGVVILHDRVLHHMLVERWRRDAGTFASNYVARMAAHHGSAGERAARDALEGRRPPPWQDDDEVVRYPLDTEALTLALGAVTHSQGHARSLRRRWLGPVAALEHPCYRAVLERAPDRPPAARADGRLQLTTVGHLIANKNVDRVVEILAADPGLAARVHYSVVGEPDEGGAHAALIAELLRANPHVSAELLGWREQAELDRLMAATDVFVNLRHPVLESGSGSLARELAHGRAILCFDGGSFGELPEGAAARVPAGDFAAAAAELRRLVEDRDRRERIARRARAVAGERTEASYAGGLLDLIERARSASPSLRLIDRAATELGTMRADPALPVYDRIARDIGRALIV